MLPFYSPRNKSWGQIVSSIDGDSGNRYKVAMKMESDKMVVVTEKVGKVESVVTVRTESQNDDRHYQ